MNNTKKCLRKLTYFHVLSMGIFGAISIDCLPAFSLKQSDMADGFILPSGNIYCLYLPDEHNVTLRCDIRSGLIPQPKGACDLDRTGIFLGKNGKAAPTCAGDTVAGNYPVLKYGRTWTRRGIKCVAKENGLSCQNTQRHGFFLSKQKWLVY